MYHARPALRWFVYLGSIGLAGLAPGREEGVPVWLLVGLAVLPLASFELGAALVGEASSRRVQAWGVRVQVVAALAYFALLLGVTARSASGTKGQWFLLGLAMFGALASAVVLWDRVRLARGLVPVGIDPMAGGERIASPAGERSARKRFADALAVIGGMPILVGAIGLAFVGTMLGVSLSRGRFPPPEIMLAMLFFGAIVLVALTQGLERWETFVPSSRVAPVRKAAQLLSFLAFGGALLGIGWLMRGDPDVSAPTAWGMIAGGVVCVVGGIAYVARTAGIGSGKGGYELVREGLLERTRRGWFLYPWAGISVALGELQGTPALLVLRDPEIAVELIDQQTDPSVERERRLARKMRSLRFSLGAFGADIVVLPVMSREPIGDLYRAAHAALTDPDVRIRLPTWRERWLELRGALH